MLVQEKKFEFGKLKCKKQSGETTVGVCGHRKEEMGTGHTGQEPHSGQNVLILPEHVLNLAHLFRSHSGQSLNFQQVPD